MKTHALDNTDPSEPPLPLHLDCVCNRFEEACKAGERPSIEAYLGDTAGAERLLLLRELLALELAYRRLAGETPALEEYRGRFPEALEPIRGLFREGDERSVSWSQGAKGAQPTSPDMASGSATAEGIDRPALPGRYRIERMLGCGTFGVVYRASDAVLERQVAIKVSRRRAESAEGPNLARLDHPGIVPVYDGGVTEDGYCYLVSKFVEGNDLRARLVCGRPSHAEAVEVVARVAEALHHAHQRRLVHRDIKPSNILLDNEGRAYVADFGLALREEDFGKGPGFAGTPPYMSPEQARGEGHRVDARSDIYSLGVVLYELLTGRRPFRGAVEEVLEQIKTCDPPPPGEVDGTVPPELDSICLKAVARRVSDRYPTALELAEDLRHWLLSHQAHPAPAAGMALRPFPLPGSRGGPAERPGGVAPKGLRPFDATDADGFLDLLPGPRDRDGLPDSIRFWKSRVEATDPESTFPVGLICGPSGCGKSSLARAGLIPRLAGAIVTVYVEADSAGTEARLLEGLRAHGPSLPGGMGLVETVTLVRRGGLPDGKKVLIVLDQFEQWLHANAGRANPELAAALRQCDGRRVQCLLLVRDDFLPAVSRFMRDLEVPLLEGQNLATIDLFDPGHARKVLVAFGRAHGRIPEAPDRPTPEQAQFLDQALAELTQAGKVIPVRLALFFDMVKGRPWAPATLQECGRAEGLGVQFLEESLGARSARPEYRRHERAAGAVLQALLPERGADLRGQTRSYEELLAASTYRRRPADFDLLLRVLDKELRLITPTEPVADVDRPRPAGGGRDYQLTHDYLVPVLREWLARKQQETRRGRAELRLTELAAVWAARPQACHLPSLGDWARIGLSTRWGEWTDSQRAMMRQATRYYLTRGAGVLALLVTVLLVGCLVLQRRNENRADALVEEAVTAPYDRLPGLRPGIEAYRRWTYPRLRAISSDPARAREERLAATLALPAEQRRPMDAALAKWYIDQVLQADPESFQVLREALAGPDHGYRQPLANRLESELNQEAPENADPQAVDRLARRQAQAGVALLHLGSDAVWEKLRHRADPRARTPRRDLRLLPPLCGLDEPRHGAGPNLRAYLLHDLARLRTDVGVVIDRLEREGNVSARRALILSLGEFAPEQVPPAERERVTALLLGWYENDPDPGVHSAIDWLLGHGWQGPVRRKLDWGQRAALRMLDRVVGERMAQKGSRILPDVCWSVTSDGEHTLAHVYQWRVPFRYGSPADESGRNPATEGAHVRRIDRRFAIATKEVTVGQFETFLAAARPDLKGAFRIPTTQDKDRPITGVPWFLAAEYCNWLTRREGKSDKELCFLVEVPTRVVLPRDYLRRRGYRLPTSAEWEYACRAGEVTSRFFGSSDALLAHYAWYGQTSQGRSWPVGQLKPNDLGLFDLYGNAAEWCLTPAPQTPKGQGEGWAGDGPIALQVVQPAQPWVVRGGAFDDAAGRLRSAASRGQLAESGSQAVGFRVARSLVRVGEPSDLP